MTDRIEFNITLYYFEGIFSANI